MKLLKRPGVSRRFPMLLYVAWMPFTQTGMHFISSKNFLKTILQNVKQQRDTIFLFCLLSLTGKLDTISFFSESLPAIVTKWNFNSSLKVVSHPGQT